MSPVNRDLLEIHDGPLTKALQDTDGKRITSPVTSKCGVSIAFLSLSIKGWRRAVRFTVTRRGKGNGKFAVNGNPLRIKCFRAGFEV